MEKYKLLQELKKAYNRGENIIQYLKTCSSSDKNTIEDILISYDFQSGTYVKGYYRSNIFAEQYTTALANVIERMGNIKSIIEIGVGEATTLCPLVNKLKEKPTNILGFDISWSRLKFAKKFSQNFNPQNMRLFTANLFEIPLLDNSIDLVYTSHSIEPNGGLEVEALKELFRITKKYLILLEPAYELATEEIRARMDKHGYAKNLPNIAKELGYKVIEYRLFDHSSNPLNPTAIIIIEKQSESSNGPDLVCPVTHSPLIPYNDSFLTTETGYITYPILEGISCLLKENAILTTHLFTDYEKFVTETKK